MAYTDTLKQADASWLRFLLIGSMILMSRPVLADDTQPLPIHPAPTENKDSDAHSPDTTNSLIPTYFEKHNQITHVSVNSQACTMPCRLWLPRGIYPVSAHGKASGVGHLVINRPTKIEFINQRTGYRTTGATLVPIGLITPTLVSLIKTCSENGQQTDPGCLIAHMTIWPILSVTLLVTGVSLLVYASGAPLKPHQVVSSHSQPKRFQKLWLSGIDFGPTLSGGSLMTTFAF